MHRRKWGATYGETQATDTDLVRDQQRSSATATNASRPAVSSSAKQAAAGHTIMLQGLAGVLFLVFFGSLGPYLRPAAFGVDTTVWSWAPAALLYAVSPLPQTLLLVLVLIPASILYTSVAAAVPDSSTPDAAAPTHRQPSSSAGAALLRLNAPAAASSELQGATAPAHPKHQLPGRSLWTGSPSRGAAAVAPATAATAATPASAAAGGVPKTCSNSSSNTQTSPSSSSYSSRPPTGLHRGSTEKPPLPPGARLLADGRSLMGADGKLLPGNIYSYHISS